MSFFLLCFTSGISTFFVSVGFSITLSSFTEPSKIVTLRVAYSTKNSGLCVTTMTSLSLETSFRSLAISLEDLTSKLPVGSSAKIIGASLARARAITVRCFSPPESLLPRWLICFISPTFSISSLAFSRRTFLSSKRSNASSTFSSTVRFSMMLKS